MIHSLLKSVDYIIVRAVLFIKILLYAIVLLEEKSAVGNMAVKLQIHSSWTYNIIKQVGNYGEVYERHLGENTVFKPVRKGTPNDLSSRGGRMYAYPIR